MNIRPSTVKKQRKFVIGEIVKSMISLLQWNLWNRSGLLFFCKFQSFIWFFSTVAAIKGVLEQKVYNPRQESLDTKGDY